MATSESVLHSYYTIRKRKVLCPDMSYLFRLMAGAARDKLTDYGRGSGLEKRCMIIVLGTLKYLPAVSRRRVLMKLD